MLTNIGMRCEGCGQVASAEHIARRLRRLEWATRYRPVHIQTLLLGGVAPREDAEFLYAPGGEFRGEAGLVLRAAGISWAGKSAEAVQAEFQGAGLFLTHILECPVESWLDTEWRDLPGKDASSSSGVRSPAAISPAAIDDFCVGPKGPTPNCRTDLNGDRMGQDAIELVRKHLPAVAARIRRSLKPKRVILVTEMPEPIVQTVLAVDLACPVVLEAGKPFVLGPSAGEAKFWRFRELLSALRGT
jgi:hypothetical protein